MKEGPSMSFLLSQQQHCVMLWDKVLLNDWRGVTSNRNSIEIRTTATAREDTPPNATNLPEPRLIILLPKLPCASQPALLIGHCWCYIALFLLRPLFRQSLTWVTLDPKKRAGTDGWGWKSRNQEVGGPRISKIGQGRAQSRRNHFANWCPMR